MTGFIGVFPMSCRTILVFMMLLEVPFRLLVLCPILLFPCPFFQWIGFILLEQQDGFHMLIVN